MSHLRTKTILFDLSHTEMLNINEEDFSELLELLNDLGLTIKTNENNDLKKAQFESVDILVLGNPINEYFSKNEFKEIINYVREGGSLLLISEYGADYLQKTNLNDLSGNEFGIYFQKNLIKEKNEFNENCSSILKIRNFNHHEITSQLREIIIGGSCSLILNGKAKPLIETDESAWTETYDEAKNEWLKDAGTEGVQKIASYMQYGRGKVFCIGDIDIFSNDENIGIPRLDNRKFVRNVINWLMEPPEEEDIFHWILNQMGNVQTNVNNLNRKINNIIESMSILEERISDVENMVHKDLKAK
ncbi:MAG: hypothetical protein BAJALOKI2v1_290022 [Promethearchaeota archaeon]|nr:MAG: hypothetical protein BAJALOKI2v1_290022 [Candidatus Lokiarchaeota archaeon]